MAVLLCVVDRSYLDRALTRRITWIWLFFVAHTLSFKELVKSIAGHCRSMEEKVISTVGAVGGQKTESPVVPNRFDRSQRHALLSLLNPAPRRVEHAMHATAIVFAVRS